jgi:hypothetical protein
MTRHGHNEASMRQAPKARFASLRLDCGGLATWSYGLQPSGFEGGIGPGGRAPLA